MTHVHGRMSFGSTEEHMSFQLVPHGSLLEDSKGCFPLIIITKEERILKKGQ